MRTKNFLLIFSIVVSISAEAQVRMLTVEEAIATSLSNNYDIQLSRNDSSLAALDYAFSKYVFFPRLNANGAYNFNNNNQKQVLADGTKRESNGIKATNATASMNLNWTLFDGLKMFITRKKLGQLIELSELEIKTQVVTTVSDVMKTYYEITAQEQALKAVREQMTLSSDRLKLAQYKFDIGTGTKQDVLQAQIDYNAERSLELSQITTIIKLKEQLNNLLVVPATNDFVVTDTIIINTDLTLDSIRSNITSTNPQLLLAQKSLDVANLTLEERRAERFPTVAFNSAYNFSRSKNRTVINPFQPLFNQNYGLNYGFTASIPIFNGNITRRNIQAAQLDIDFQALQYKKNLAQINTDINLAFRDYGLYRQTLALEEENIKLVRENLFIARERYRLGVTTFIEMRTAEQNLADAQRRLIQARYNTKVAEIDLMRLRGDLIQ